MLRSCRCFPGHRHCYRGQHRRRSGDGRRSSGSSGALDALCACRRARWEPCFARSPAPYIGIPAPHKFLFHRRDIDAAVVGGSSRCREGTRGSDDRADRQLLTGVTLPAAAGAFPGDLSPCAACLAQADGNGLFAAGHLLPRAPGLEGPALAFVHRAFHFALGFFFRTFAISDRGASDLPRDLRQCSPHPRTLLPATDRASLLTLRRPRLPTLRGVRPPHGRVGPS